MYLGMCSNNKITVKHTLFLFRAFLKMQKTNTQYQTERISSRAWRRSMIKHFNSRQKDIWISVFKKNNSWMNMNAIMKLIGYIYKNNNSKDI